MKLGISLSRELARASDALAHEMGVSRSRLYSMALRDFIRRHENTSLLEKLNDAYREPDSEDEPLLRGIKRHGRSLPDEDER